jgi:hypothetical protein
VEEWDGLDDVKGNAARPSGSDSDSDSEEEIDNRVDSLLTSLGPRLDARSKGKLSKRAALFFDQPDFEGIDGEEGEDREDEDEEDEDVEAENMEVANGVTNNFEDVEDIDDSESENGFEVVKIKAPEPDTWDDSDDEKAPTQPSTFPSLRLI